MATLAADPIEVARIGSRAHTLGRNGLVWLVTACAPSSRYPRHLAVDVVVIDCGVVRNRCTWSVADTDDDAYVDVHDLIAVT